MKYYIPTTTLNFNNILSSESISPSIFFQKRGFGYSRWFKIAENEQNNSIILYDSLSRLERGESDLEDHPMIIEITTDEIFHEIEKGIYVTDKTIYLNPWNTRFIFLREQDKLVTISLSDSSLETKMIRLYQKGFEVYNPTGAYSCITNEISSDANIVEIEHDRIINRLKGLLYGYYIGALLSCDKSGIEYYNTLKDLQNIFAAILSNPSRQPSKEQENKVISLVGSLLFRTPLFREIERIVNNRDKAVEIVNACSKYGKAISNLDPNFFFRELRDGVSENNPALQWVSDELKRVSSISATNRVLLSPEDSEIVVADNKLRSIKETVISNRVENQLFIGLVNYILTAESISGKISSQRSELTDTLTAVAKNILGTDWELSPIRTYMNLLRRHVRGDEFNQKWDNGVLSSLAAVILKGDDWEVLLDFMKRKGMTNYRLAFAFYGVMNGFANLTRDFTDLLLNNDSSYVASVYKEFHGSIHGEKIDISSKVMASERPKEINTSHTTIKSFKDRVWEFYCSNVRKGKRNQHKLDEELKSALEKIGDSDDGYVFVCVLNDYSKWSSKTKAWQEMQQEFCPDYEMVRNSKRKTNDSTSQTALKRAKETFSSVKDALGGLFTGFEDSGDSSSNRTQKSFSQVNANYPVNLGHIGYTNNPNTSNQNRDSATRSIIFDDYAIEVIRSFIGVDSQLILDIFIEFQKSYRSGYYSKNPSQYRRNNSDVIDHFCKWCLSPKNRKALERTPDNSRKLDELKSYLLRFYHD
ncbi:hypothetical protein HDR58_07030 [bacterium]|nr:hypothetical protein [bacterium]